MTTVELMSDLSFDFMTHRDKYGLGNISVGFFGQALITLCTLLIHLKSPKMAMRRILTLFCDVNYVKVLVATRD